MSYENKGSQAYVTVSILPDKSGNFVCDGTADQIQIQAAVDYVEEMGGGTVFIKKGSTNYQLSDVPILIDSGNVRITGDYPLITLATDILRGAVFGDWAIFHVDTSQSDVDNVEIDHIRADISGQGASYGSMNNPDQRGSFVTAGPGFVFGAEATWQGHRWASDVKIHDNVVTEPFISGISCLKCKNVQIFNNEIRGSDQEYASSHKHICVLNCEDFHIYENESHMYEDDSDWIMGSCNSIFVFIVGQFSTYNSSCRHGSISGNHLWGCGDSSIEVNGGTGAGNDAYNITIVNNVVHGRGIVLSRKCRDMEIVGNSLYWPSGENTGAAMIPIFSGGATGAGDISNILVSDNFIDGSYNASGGLKAGIIIYPYTGYTCKNIYVCNNYITGIGDYNAAGTGTGIEIDGNDLSGPALDHIYIVDNYIQNCESSGIYVHDTMAGANIDLIGNRIVDISGDGIDLQDGLGNIKVFDNLFENVTTYLDDDAAYNAILRTVSFPFIAPDSLFDLSGAMGVEIDAGGESAYTWGLIPYDAQRVYRISYEGVILAAPGVGNAMRLTMSVYAGGEDEAYNAESISTSKKCDTDNLAVNDIVVWTLNTSDDADIDDIVGGDSFQAAATYVVGSGEDIATDALIRTVTFHYV